MPPCNRPSGCLRFSRTSKRTWAELCVSFTQSSPRNPSNVRWRGMSGAGSVATSHGQGLPTDDHRLGLGVVVKRLLAVLLAVAARFPASEREFVVDLGAGVDPRVAGLDPFRRHAGPVEIARPDRGAEAELRGVGALDR